MAATKSKPEDAVRAYLQALTDPESLRDDARIAQLEKQASSEQDPIKRLKLKAELRRETQADGKLDMLEADFIANAKQWAEDNSVTADDFSELGVDGGVLADAGLLPRTRRRGVSSARRSRISFEDVQKAIPRGEFTVRDVMDKTGASRATVVKAIESLKGVKVVTEGGRGRAAVYQR